MNLFVHTDGVPRCNWNSTDDDYLRYHDTEWGRPLRGETDLFERLSLEAFQSGLSWLTILRKRENFRRAFADFSPDAVAAFTATDTERLLQDVGIVRNRRKVDATIANAQAVVALRAGGGLQALIEAHLPASHDRPGQEGQRPAFSAESVALAKALKKAGFRHVGPTTCYSMLQACGFINDHVVGCAAGDEIDAARS